ncbi:hypothetical protein [Georgenia sp. H159]|uniref:hypothetical protein n=1 Tax=Georgenia sp. H159 TaxID=3076115 RepID=UPI002D79E5F2|nr:hypothetical protein [Georgenia sp. H159]
MSRARVAGVAVAVAAVAAAMWLVGFAGVNIALAAGATVTLGALLGHRDLGREHALPRLTDERRGGHRHEVSQLAWSLTTRDGRVGDAGMRQLRDVAATRLTTAGIAPDDDAAVRAALGDRAWRTLRSPAPQTVRALDACLTALENLEGARR